MSPNLKVKHSLRIATFFQILLVALVFMQSAPMAVNADTSTKTPTYTSENPPFDPSTEDDDLTSVAEIDLGQNDPVTVTYRIINIALTFLGIGFLVLLVYAGTLWVIARGNSEGIDKAKHLIRQAVIGLIIILSAYGVAATIFQIIDLSTSGDLESLQTDGTP